MRRLLVLLAALVLVSAATLGGYALGHSRGADVEAARADGERAGAIDGKAQGEARGRADGLRAGRKAGYRETYRKAHRVAYRKTYDRETKPVAVATPPAPPGPTADQQERARNCGAPLFVDGYCPTDEEVEHEHQAEGLCGGGHYGEARRAGVACFPPGDPRNP